LSRLPETEARALIPPHAARLAQAFPALRPIVWEQEHAQRSGPPSTLDSGPRDPREQRAQLFAAARALFTNLAARLPVVLVIDALQWGGADSLALLHEALRPPDAPGLLLVATLRDVPQGFARSIHPETIEIALGPLDQRDARDLALDALAGLHHGALLD